MPDRRQFLQAVSLPPFAAALPGCDPSDSRDASTMALAVTPEHWQAIAGKRIFFGHQTVGVNIMAGVQDLLKESGGAFVRVVDSLDPQVYAAPVFGHARIGFDERPLTKLNGFIDAVANKLRGAVDIAFFKFGPTDFKPDSDVTALFNRYREAAAQLRQRYPQIAFAHVTVPLTTATLPLKQQIQRLIGRSDERMQSNLQRERFNGLMRKAYEHQPLFDLAHWESISETGERKTFNAAGQAHAALVNGYSDDGSHLNPRGRRWVAGKLLAFLAELGPPTALA